jgi:TctA family transporter
MLEPYVIDLIYSAMIGMMAGLVVGILPAIPIFLGFMVAVNFVPVSPECYVITAVVTTIGSQFFGSVAALYYKIPGEQSSFPVLIEAQQIKDPRTIYEAIQLTAMGSLVATIVSATLMYAALAFGIFDGVRVGLELRFVLMVILVAMGIFTGGKTLYNLLALIMGTLLIFYEDWAPYSPLPQYYFNGMLGLIIIFSFQLIWNKPLEVDQRYFDEKIKEIPVKYMPWMPKMISRAFIGVPFGLIPQVGSTLSSYACYIWEKIKGRDAMHRMVAAETANNGAIIFCWLPLFLFGVPIGGTEMLLVTQYNMYDLNFSWLKDPNKQVLLYSILVISGFFYYFLAKSANKIIYKNMIGIINSRIFSITLVALTLLLFYNMNGFAGSVILTHLIVFVPVSYFVYRYNVNLLAVVVALLLTEGLAFSSYQMYQIYLK